MDAPIPNYASYRKNLLLFNSSGIFPISGESSKHHGSGIYIYFPLTDVRSEQHGASISDFRLFGFNPTNRHDLPVRFSDIIPETRRAESDPSPGPSNALDLARFDYMFSGEFLHQ